jgi:serine/threonine-protein kinase
MSEHFVRLKTALAGRYEIDREIGSGGMATVYLGADVRHHRNVAIKLLRSEFDVAGGRDRFLREIEILGQLRHPHILPLLDSGAIDDLCFFVMPHCEGETLRVRLVRDGVLPIDEAVQYASEIADALTYAHAHGVIHRDVKPQNVFVQVMPGFIVEVGQVQCEAFQLCPSSCAVRSVAHRKLLLKSDCESP